MLLKQSLQILLVLESIDLHKLTITYLVHIESEAAKGFAYVAVSLISKRGNLRTI